MKTKFNKINFPKKHEPDLESREVIFYGLIILGAIGYLAFMIIGNWHWVIG